MPEGPEVHRMADRLRRYLGDQPADEVWFAFPHLRRWGRTLQGEWIHAVEARGKAFLIELDSVWIYVHLQLYGRWYVRTPRGGDPRTNRSLRLKLVTPRGRALLYSASEIEVLDEEGVAAHPYLSTLGPDVLRRGLTARSIAARYRSRRFRRRALGGLLLDKGFLAGVGNYLRSEILFQAGLRPQHKPAELDGDQLERLARHTLRVCRQAYQTGGVTNDPDRVAELKAQGQARRDYRHHVFGREARGCWTCATPIERATVGGRRLYLCPECQR